MYQLETMDDSSLFMQWAVDTLQHDHPPLAAAYAAGDSGCTFPSLQELRRSALQQGTAPAGMAVQDGHRHQAADSAGGGCENTSAAVVENDVNCATTCSVGSSNNYLPMSWNFTSAVAQPSNEAAPSPTAAPPSGAHDGPGVTEQAHVSPPSRRASAKSAARTGHTPYAQDHTMAERKRREKINRRFIELSTVIPGLKKMDKATILSDAVKYVKEQQEKLKALEVRNCRSVAAESVVLVKKSRTAEDDGGGCCSSPSAGPGATAGTGSTTTTTTTGSVLPEIEARVSESDVMVRIHCEDGKGVLVRLLAEVEGLHLSITHVNAIPFPACTVVITVTAKVDDGFSVTAEDIVGKLEAALHAPTATA
ncbi:transcription factor NAI1-like [Aegilops tauschii subsp. strangulata]|uniref:BHLH domain-containing protein n=1 Tax=Aegilops tauschii subsp. strangulata TaxID=200361 RepID=A0A453H200_AEGTS|nr:transcription factor bHLH18-like [Aegilops tauschii subsp. strangulata]